MNRIKAILQRLKGMERMNTFFDKWLKSKHHLKAQSIRTYTQFVDGYLRPAFGETAIKDINRERVQAFVDAMQENYSAKTIHEVYRCLKAALELAVSQRIIIENPCAGITLPTKEKTRAQALSDKEQRTLGKALSKSTNPLDLSILLALKLGLRLSEVVALRWKDIEFKENFVVVRHSMERVPTGEGRQTKARLGTPKTKNSQRKIPLPGDFAAELKSYYDQLNVKQKKGTSFVVSKKDGNAYHGRTIERHFKKRGRELGLSSAYTFHSLRHSFATQAMESGVAVKVISVLLGHSKTATTTEIYLHLSEHFIRQEMMKMSLEQKKKHQRAKPKVPAKNAA